jgi:outer membrane protein TolC
MYEDPKSHFLIPYPYQFASLILASSCVLLVSLTALAQTPAPSQQPAQQPSQESITQIYTIPPPIPERTIGLEPGRVVHWSRRDAILAAFANSVDIELETETVRLAQWDLLAAQGVYDPTTTSSIGHNSNIAPNTFQFSGATGVPSTVSNTYSYNFGFQQMIEKTGASYQITFNNSREWNNTRNLSLNYNPSLGFEITQPLFRNFKIDQYRNQIKIRKKELDMSDAQFRRRAIEIISDVEQAYWSLYVAIENEKIAREALALAEKQMRDNMRQVEVGTLAPIDITEAATEVESRRSQVYTNINEVARTETELKKLTVDGPDSDLWKARIITTEPFEVNQYTLPLDDAIKLAKENRFEIKRYNLQKEMNQISIDFYRNQARPQIDLVASYSLAGVGGRARNNVFPSFIGGYGTSLRNMFSNDFRTWEVGLSFSLPLRNRVAKANLARAREVEKQTELLIRQQLQNIEAEVRIAVQAVETAKLRIESTRQQRIHAKQQLDGENMKFRAGLSPVFFVLERQNALSAAQFAENGAKADYARAISNLEKVLSTTLSSNSIEIPDPQEPE